jgi:hypothetical protein
MKEKKLPTHLIFAIVHFSLAIATLIPSASASKPSLLGYKALCSFSPIGTLILIYVSVLHYMLWRSQSS